MNALVSLFHSLTNYRYETYNRRSAQTANLEPEAIRLLNSIYQYGAMDHETAAAILRTGSIHPHFRYRHFNAAKKDGTTRQLVEPDERLKKVQRRILKKLLDTQTSHRAAMGYRKNSSTADHVWAHAGAEIIIAADIEDFFPNTKAWRVAQWWQTQHENEQAVRLLTLLTTYKDSLPQGAPTSPSLSNLINMSMDTSLHQRAQNSGGSYTRYCDDMVFSWQSGSQPPADFEYGVRAVLGEHGYSLHPSKGWRVYSRHDEPEITGAILTRNGNIELPQHMRNTMRQLARSSDPHDAKRLQGYRAYETMMKQK